MKKVFTAAQMMTIAVKEIEMCVANGEKIPREWYCWTCSLTFGEFDKPKHDGHDFEEEGQWA